MTKRQTFNGWHKITNTQKTKDWDAQTQLKIWIDMNSDVPYESTVHTSLKTLHGRKSWGKLPSPLWKIEGGANSFAPLFGIKFKKITFFYFSMEAYI